MFAFTLLVVSLLCLAFDSTKLVGFAGMTLLFYVYPPLLAVFLILGGVGLIFIHHQRIRLDCVSEANHNLNRLLDKPGLFSGGRKIRKSKA